MKLKLIIILLLLIEASLQRGGRGGGGSRSSGGGSRSSGGVGTRGTSSSTRSTSTRTTISSSTGAYYYYSTVYGAIIYVPGQSYYSSSTEPINITAIIVPIALVGAIPLAFLLALFLSKLLKISFFDSLRVIFCCYWCLLCPKVPRKKKEAAEARIE